MTWYPGEVKLIYRPIVEASEGKLIPLEGGTFVLPKGCRLPSRIAGSKLLTNNIKKLSAFGFINDELTLTTSPSKGLYTASHLFGDAVTIENLAQTGDQWLSSSSDLNTSEYVQIEFRENKSADIPGEYLISEYWMIPAYGWSEQPLGTKATPNTWRLRGSHDGKNWATITKVENFTDWEPMKIRTFSTGRTRTSYRYLKLEITKWNPGDPDDPIPLKGLKRLWIFGRPKNTWIAPNLDSPDPAFVWAVHV